MTQETERMVMVPARAIRAKMSHDAFGLYLHILDMATDDGLVTTSGQLAERMRAPTEKITVWLGELVAHNLVAVNAERLLSDGTVLIPRDVLDAWKEEDDDDNRP